MRPEDLPVYQQRDRIINELQQNNVIVVESPTGSGKTTQIPLILHAAGYSQRGIIGVTQPRRIAAISVSDYMAKQLKTTIPGLAGYKIRFSDKTNHETLLKIMTDGILLQELKADRLLSKYSVIMVDEAHERSLNIDFVLGLLKQVISERPDFKVIISSATINTDVFSNYFDGCPVIHIDAHIYPVDINYKPLSLRDNPEVLVNTIAEIVRRRLKEDPEGDMLIFLPGERLITDCVMQLDLEDPQKRLEIYPLFGRLPKEEQERVFYPTSQGKRKIVVATNIAETSITIDNITTVIDSGLAKINYYNPKTYTSSLIEEPISKASCSQRKGRAGRTGAGVCWRLYDKNDFDRRIMFTPEEIRRTDLSEVILRMAELGIYDFTSFDFITNPGVVGIESAVETLRFLNALNAENKLTTTGELMVQFPLLPRYSRIIVEAIIKYHDVLEETIIAASFLSARSPFVLPLGEEIEARHAHHSFSSQDGDFLSYVTLYRAYRKLTGDAARTKFCQVHYLEKQTMNELLNIVEQLSEIVSDMGIPIASGGSIHDYLCAVASGLIQFVCVKTGKNNYRSLTADQIHIHPGSNMFRQSPRFLVAGEIVRTSRIFARSVSPLRQEWLAHIHKDLAAKLFPEKEIHAKRTAAVEEVGKKEKKRETITLFRKQFPIEKYKGNKKMAIIPLEDLSSGYQGILSELPRHKSLRVQITYNAFSFHTGDRLKSVMKAVPFMKQDQGIFDSPPAGSFNPETDADMLFDNLELLLCFCKVRKGSRTLGFITLDNDSDGNFRFKTVRNFHTATDTALYSMETLADNEELNKNPGRKKRLNEVYRELTSIFEA